jgi:signal transduction histidine kinase
MHPASPHSLLTYNFSFRNLCLMALGESRPLLLLNPSELKPDGTAQPSRSAGTSNANAMLAALADINASEFSNLAELTATYLAAILRLLGVRGALITQMVDNTITLSASSTANWELPPDKDFAFEASFCQHVRASGAPLSISDALLDTRVNDIAMQKELGIRAYLGVPIYTLDGSFYGTVCAVDPLPRTFSRAEVDLLRIVAGHIAAAAERQDSTRAALQAEQDMQSVLRTLDERSTMLRVVAHDMRTPLSSISGFVELLQQYALGPVSSAQQEALSRIKLASVFITRLAEDLIDALTVETQTLALLSEALDPCLIALNVLELCRPLAVDRGLALQFRGAGDLPQVVGDPERLQQVLFNLLSNALRYTVEGQVALIVDSYREMVEFRVEDTGPGIPKDLQGQIWKPYTRATTSGQGLGLGLYVVQRLTLAMGGSVGLRSAEGQGSAFWVRLPSQARVQAVGDSLEEE